MEYKNRNCSIDMFRMVCACLVLLIHIPLFFDIDSNLSYFVSHILTRCAVPYFFCISGYFYTRKLIQGRNCFIHTFIGILRIYTIWTIIYYLYDIIMLWKKGESFIIWGKDAIVNYLFLGSSGHFWFFTALLFCIALVSLLHHFGGLKILAFFSLVFYIYGVFYWTYEKTGYLMLSRFAKRLFFVALPFYMLGYYLNLFKEKTDKLTDKKIYGFNLVFIASYFIEIVWILSRGFDKSIVITFGLYPMIAALIIFFERKPFTSKVYIANYMRAVANFIYYSHILLRNLVRVFCFKVFNWEIELFPLFFIVLAIGSISGIFIAKLNNKYINLCIF